jgi:hypothetical protein
MIRKRTLACKNKKTIGWKSKELTNIYQISLKL